MFKIKIKILPNSSKNEIVKTESDIKIKITAQPIEGRANKGLIEFLSKEFHIPKTSIQILKGLNCSDKIIGFDINNEEKLNFIKDRLGI